MFFLYFSRDSLYVVQFSFLFALGNFFLVSFLLLGLIFHQRTFRWLVRSFSGDLIGDSSICYIDSLRFLALYLEFRCAVSNLYFWVSCILLVLYEFSNFLLKFF